MAKPKLYVLKEDVYTAKESVGAFFEGDVIYEVTVVRKITAKIDEDGKVTNLEAK